MDFQSILSLFKDVTIILGVLVGGLISMKLYLQFAPIVIFRITPSWSVVSLDTVVLKIEFENKSKVKLTKKELRFKVIRYKKSDVLELKEWVDIKDAEIICETTDILYPGDVVRVDRLYTCKDDEILQGIIQFHAKYSRLEKLLANVKGENESWTNTFIIVR